MRGKDRGRHRGKDIKRETREAEGGDSGRANEGDSRDRMRETPNDKETEEMRQRESGGVVRGGKTEGERLRGKQRGRAR